MVKNRIEYYDNLRVLAIFGIIAIHVFQLWHHGEQVNGMYIYMFSEIVRYAVPIFLMLSGALLLNRDIELSYFLRHKITRIAYPFIFYLILSFILSLFTDKGFSYNIFSSTGISGWFSVSIYLFQSLTSSFSMLQSGKLNIS